jgi:hypothetical protein
MQFSEYTIYYKIKEIFSATNFCTKSLAGKGNQKMEIGFFLKPRHEIWMVSFNRNRSSFSMQTKCLYYFLNFHTKYCILAYFERSSCGNVPLKSHFVGNNKKVNFPLPLSLYLFCLFRELMKALNFLFRFQL